MILPPPVATVGRMAHLSRRTPRLLPVLLVASMLVAACGSSTPSLANPSPSNRKASSSGPGATAGPPEGATSERSAWQQVLAQIGPDGTVTADTALQAFSLAIGPLPGVTVPAGPIGSIRSGSGAVRWLVGHWKDITEAQRAEAIRLIPELAGVGKPPIGDRSPADAKLVTYTGGVFAPSKPPIYWTTLAYAMAAEIETHTHLHLDLTITAAEGLTQKVTSAAETVVLNAQGGYTGKASKKCVITVSAGGAAQDFVVLEDMMGHEIWHCYQGQIRGPDWYYSTSTPTWLIEGQAEWVGDALRPTTQAPSWDDYIPSPGKTLFSRSYDALGFYAHLTQSGIETWDVLVNMLQADDNDVARFEASGATSDGFLDTWASSFFRQPAVGPAWELEGPGLPSRAGPGRLVLAAANGETTPFSAPAYTNSIFSLSSNADIVSFAIHGHVRLGDPGHGQEYVLAGTSFCTKDGGCICPPGTAFDGAPPNPLSAETLLAVTGGMKGARGTVTGHSLDEFCHKQGGGVWSMVFWSPDLGESAPPLLAAYTCGGLISTWKAIFLPGPSRLQRTFELPFGANPVVHQDLHYDIPPDKLSKAQKLDYSIDFALDAAAVPPVIKVSGTKTESEGSQSRVFQPREFGSDAPLVARNVSLEAQLKGHPELQHPFRAQALAECGG